MWRVLLESSLHGRRPGLAPSPCQPVPIPSILDRVGSSSVRLGHSELVVPDSRPGLSFVDRPLLPLRLDLRRGPVLAGRSMSGLRPIRNGMPTGSVLSHADFQPRFRQRGLSPLLLTPSRSILSLFPSRFPFIFVGIVPRLLVVVFHLIGLTWAHGLDCCSLRNRLKGLLSTPVFF